MLVDVVGKIGSSLKCVLASTSPRRIEIMKLLGLNVEVVASTFAEDLSKTAHTPEEYVQLTARYKALEVFRARPDAHVVIGADTMIVAPRPELQLGERKQELQSPAAASTSSSASNASPTSRTTASAANSSSSSSSSSTSSISSSASSSSSTSSSSSSAPTEDSTPAALVLGKPRDAQDAFRILSLLSGRTHSVLTGVSIFYRTSPPSQSSSSSSTSTSASCSSSSSSAPSAPPTAADDGATAVTTGAGSGAGATGAAGTPASALSALKTEAGEGELTFCDTTLVSFAELSPQLIEGYIATGEPLDKAGAYGIQGVGGSFVTGIQGCFYNVMGFPTHKFALRFRALVDSVFGIK